MLVNRTTCRHLSVDGFPIMFRTVSQRPRFFTHYFRSPTFLSLLFNIGCSLFFLSSIWAWCQNLHPGHRLTNLILLLQECFYRVTRRVSLVEQELLTLPEHLSSPSIFSGVRITRSLVLCVMFCRLLFVLLSFFLLAIVLSVLFRFTDSDYPFSVFKLILKLYWLVYYFYF